jgi:hypothetical protein
MSIPSKLRHLIAERDQYRCAYCLTSEENCGLRMHIDHIIPEVKGGKTVPENLCLVCFSCNVHKSARETGQDSVTGEHARLFHPLRQNWGEHFVWDKSGTHIIGVTPCGRVTVLLLSMNNSVVVQARRRWVSAGWHPPELYKNF